MTDEELKEIRRKICCPQLDDEHYGEWGILTLNQRLTIKRMLDFIESQEEHIKQLEEEDEELNAEVEVLKIPCGTIIYTKDKWLVLNMESQDLGRAIKSCVEYLTKNEKGG